MARGNSTVKGGQTAGTPANTSADTIEQQVVAFAEQLGRIVGTVQAKTEGWLDPTALSDQLSHVRDSASSLLEQLGASKLANATRSREQPAAATERAGAATGGGRGRSGGAVDAPGKKHRKPTANQPLRANAADRARVAKMKAANSSRRRGRG